MYILKGAEALASLKLINFTAQVDVKLISAEDSDGGAFLKGIAFCGTFSLDLNTVAE